MYIYNLFDTITAESWSRNFHCACLALLDVCSLICSVSILLEKTWLQAFGRFQCVTHCQLLQDTDSSKTIAASYWQTRDSSIILAVCETMKKSYTAGQLAKISKYQKLQNVRIYQTFIRNYIRRVTRTSFMSSLFSYKICFSHSSVSKQMEI